MGKDRIMAEQGRCFILKPVHIKTKKHNLECLTISIGLPVVRCKLISVQNTSSFTFLMFISICIWVLIALVGCFCLFLTFIFLSSVKRNKLLSTFTDVSTFLHNGHWSLVQLEDFTYSI